MGRACRRGMLLRSMMLALVCLVSCSDSGKTATPDQRPSRDLSATGDGPGPDRNQGSDRPRASDQTASTDGPAGRCDPACRAESRELCVKNPSGACVECATDADCAGNPTALGPACDAGSCVCVSDGECSGNANGSRCDGTFGNCSCTASSDCKTAGFDACDPNGGYAGWCVAACKSDSDCTGNPETPVCGGDGVCAQCKGTSDCSTAQDGSACIDRVCACASSTDCAGVYAWGGTCDKAAGLCGCGAAADCVGNGHGPICNGPLGLCTCTEDSQCTFPPYNQCALIAQITGSLRVCQKTCAKDADCASKTSLKKCSAGKCVQCVTDADCASQATKKTCQTAVGLCG